ncbi:aminotransferase class V-fold PLP-dependent enzyme [Nannocystaceae bacterium ST9]
MPLDPDEIRTPPTPAPVADEPAEPANASEPSTPTPELGRLIDRLDDAARPSASGEPRRASAPEFTTPTLLDLPRALEPDSGTAAAWMDQISSFVLELLRTIPQRPAQGMVGPPAEQLAARLSQPIPERPLEGGLARALEIVGRSLDAGLETAGPGYLAYVPGGGLYAAGLADLIADVGNRFTGYSMSAPGWVRLEQDVLRWLAEQFGYGPRAEGLLTSGSSLANFAALVAARHHHFGDTGDYSRALVYSSTQAHHSIGKALTLAGIPRANLRAVAVDDRLRLDVDDLARTIAHDRHRGLRPFCVIAAAGTTNTGAIDPLGELADLCAREDLWLHVDGAYGGAFVLSPSGRARLAGIERADSICFDPHKGMFLPYGTGCLLVREGSRLAAAHAGTADYLRDLEGSMLGPAELGPELSRPFRGLRLWLPLMLHGAQAFRDALEEKLALAHHCAAGLDQRIDQGAPLELVASPQLSTVAFRLRRREPEPLAEWNARNGALLDAINRRGRAFLSSTELPLAGERVVTLRVCVLSFRTHRERIDTLLDDLDLALAE